MQDERPPIAFTHTAEFLVSPRRTREDRPPLCNYAPTRALDSPGVVIPLQEEETRCAPSRGSV
jgi:hypothetical protein